MTSLAIVTLNYGNPTDTIELYQTFKMCNNYDKVEFLIIDNASGQIFIDALISGLRADRINDSEYKIDCGLLIIAPLNRGYASGNNIGINYCLRQSKISHIWLLNNDTLLDIDSIDIAIEASQKFSEDILGSTLIYDKDSRIQCLGGAKFNKLFFKGEYLYEGEKMDVVEKIDPTKVNNEIEYVHGASMIIPVSLIKIIGNLSENYFLYFEEIDFCYRAKVTNAKLIWIHNLKIRHKDGASINGFSYKIGKSKLSEYHSMKSSLIFAKVWYPSLYPRVVVVRILIKFIINVLAQRWHLIGVNFKAFYDLSHGK